MKIGICDDEPHVCKQMQAEVNHYYHSLDILPVTFSHAEQLIEALRKDPDNFLCIFMDIELEGLDGITASRLIQGMNLNIPIILLTSHSEFAPEGYEISAFRFLTKPLDRKKNGGGFESRGNHADTEPENSNLPGWAGDLRLLSGHLLYKKRKCLPANTFNPAILSGTRHTAEIP